MRTRELLLSSAMTVTMTSPRSLISRVLFFFLDGLEYLHHMRTPLHRLIEPEEKIRHEPESHAPAEFGPDEGRGALEPFERILPASPVYADEDLCVPEVIGDVNAGHGNEADPRVLYLPHEDVRYLVR